MMTWSVVLIKTSTDKKSEPSRNPQHRLLCTIGCALTDITLTALPMELFSCSAKGKETGGGQAAREKGTT